MGKVHEIAKKLDAELDASAFRHGTSAFRFGLIPRGISDHLPIKVDLDDFSLLSWNLLCDDHLYNNFMNVSGSDLLIKTVFDNPEKHSPYFDETGNRLYHFFVELARFFYKDKSKEGLITVNPTSLNDFLDLEKNPCRLARSRNPMKAKEKEQQILDSRKRLWKAMFSQTHPEAHEFRLAIQHSLELFHFIEPDSAPLKWKQRFEYLKAHPGLTDEICQSDIICLQECTSPEDMMQLYKMKGKNMESIVYATNERSKDHCAIFYNKEKFTLIGEPVRYALHGSKPCVAIKLHDNIKGTDFIVSSIHHPGGSANELKEIVRQTEQLMQNTSVPCYIVGDYNHAKDFFEKDENISPEYKMRYPELGTMAGSDYGNTNCSIDALLTNLKHKINVSKLEHLPVSRPISPSIILRFEQENSLATYASSRFFNPVKTSSSNEDREVTLEALGKNNAKIGLRKPLI